MAKHDSCEGCKHDLGGGRDNCRINLEYECRDGGEFEAYEVLPDTAVEELINDMAEHVSIDEIKDELCSWERNSLIGLTGWIVLGLAALAGVWIKFSWHAAALSVYLGLAGFWVRTFAYDLGAVRMAKGLRRRLEEGAAEHGDD